MLYGVVIHSRMTPMAKPNYAYEKRQRELEKKNKKAEKAQKKAHAAEAPAHPPVAADPETLAGQGPALLNT